MTKDDERKNIDRAVATVHDLSVYVDRYQAESNAAVDIMKLQVPVL